MWCSFLGHPGALGNQGYAEFMFIRKTEAKSLQVLPATAGSLQSSEGLGWWLPQLALQYYGCLVTGVLQTHHIFSSRVAETQLVLNFSPQEPLPSVFVVLLAPEAHAHLPLSVPC